MNKGELTSFPLDFNTDIQEISLYNHQITTIPPEIAKFTNLTTLTLGCSQIKSISLELGNLTKLKVLSLDFNEITTIPPEIGKLTNLILLSLRENNITSIPSEIGTMINLRCLSLSGNQIANIPSEIGDITKLADLNLHNNQITNIPREIGHLTNLQTLFISKNPISCLPYSCRNIPALGFDKMRTNNVHQIVSIPTLYDICCAFGISYFSQIDTLMLPLDIRNRLCNDIRKCDKCGKVYFGGNENRFLVAQKRNCKRIVYAMDLCVFCAYTIVNAQ